MERVKKLICEAIAEKKCLRFSYHGKVRIVEPHILGADKHGNELLSAYFVGGHTQSAKAPFWRSYSLDEITSLQKLDDGFAGPRKGYNPHDPKMAIIFCRLTAETLRTKR
jgi:hypothetical protein